MNKNYKLISEAK